MSNVPHVIPSPELKRATELIVNGCNEIHKMLEPKDGRVPKPNIKAALHLLAETFKAHEAMDRANYAEVERLMDWAAPEVSA